MSTNPSRERILATIRSGLVENRAWLESEAGAASRAAIPYVLPRADNLADQFADELRKLEGRVYRAADDEDALEAISQILDAKAASELIAWDLDQIELPGLDVLLAQRGVQLTDTQVLAQADHKERLQTLEPAQVCISGVAAGIAESGSLAIVHGPGRSRLASLLAPFHIAIVRESQLVRGLGEAFDRIRAQYGADPFVATSNITLITGPSRTADIEMTLTLGIHGPKEIHVVVIADM